MVADAELQARYEGDEVHCACGRVIAVGVVPARAGARVPCKACGRWVTLPLRPRPRNTSAYPFPGMET